MPPMSITDAFGPPSGRFASAVISARPKNSFSPLLHQTDRHECASLRAHSAAQIDVFHKRSRIKFTVFAIGARPIAVTITR